MFDFDESYRNLKTGNKDGWNSEELTQSQFDIVTSILQRNRISSGSLLDLGCGDGKLTIKLAQAGFTASGIDISPTAINWAKERLKARPANAEFRVGNVLALPYESDVFNVAADSFCFHCIIGESRKEFLSESLRVLKKHGNLIIMSKCGDPKDPDYPFDPVTRCKMENGIPTRYMGLPETIVEEVKNAGFAILDYQVFTYNQDLLVINARKV